MKRVVVTSINGINHRACSHCKLQVPLSDFYAKSSWCKQCHKEKCRKHRETHRQELIDSSTEWRKNNPNKFAIIQYRAALKRIKKLGLEKEVGL